MDASRRTSPYVWARLAFGPRAAFFIGWLTYVSALFSSATVVTGLSEHLLTIVGNRLLPQKAVALLAVLVLCLATSAGLRVSALAWSAVTVLKVLPLLLLTGLALQLALFGRLPSASPPPTGATVDIGRALLLVVFALQGFEVVPVLAGSARVQRSVPWATLGTLVACTAFYVVLHAICVVALPDLATQKAPLVAAAQVLGGDFWARLLSAGQIVSALGIAFGQFVTTPRYLAALGREDALGSWIGAVDVRLVPQRAVWITGASAALFVLREDLGALFALSSIAVLAQYAVAVLSLALLAKRGHHDVARKRAIWALPALIGIALVARGAEPRELLTTAAVTVLGALLLLVRRRR